MKKLTQRLTLLLITVMVPMVQLLHAQVPQLEDENSFPLIIPEKVRYGLPLITIKINQDNNILLQHCYLGYKTCHPFGPKESYTTNELASMVKSLKSETTTRAAFATAASIAATIGYYTVAKKISRKKGDFPKKTALGLSTFLGIATTSTLSNYIEHLQVFEKLHEYKLARSSMDFVFDTEFVYSTATPREDIQAFEELLNYYIEADD